MNTVCLGVAVVSLGLFAVYAATIASYPWDWDPGEWGSIDSAHRLIESPETLYPRGTVIPIPQTYGPTLALLLIPVLWLKGNPYFAARLMMFAITLAILLAAYTLVRRRASRKVALLSSALIVVPFNQSFWYLLVRVDGLMIALWFGAAVLALPQRLCRGCDDLPWRRAWLAGAFLGLAIITKATAVLFAAALVVGWLLVNLRSALRLAIAALATSTALFALLQGLTRGGFSATLALQKYFPHRAGQIADLLVESFELNWESLALFLIAMAVAWRRKDGRFKDGAWLLWAAGPLTVPLLSKSGAVFNYLLPFFAGQAVLIGRWLGPAEKAPFEDRPRAYVMASLPGLVLALSVACIAARRPFPLPDAQDRLTSQSFFAFVKERGKPILAASPHGAYAEVGQLVEVEHAAFLPYLRAGLPGTSEVLARIRNQSYRLLIANQTDMRLQGAPYRPVGLCELAFYYGPERLTLLVPRSSPTTVRFAPLPGSRCKAFEARVD